MLPSWAWENLHKCKTWGQIQSQTLEKTHKQGTGGEGGGGSVPLEMGKEKMRKQNICFSVSSTEVEKK